MNRSRFEAMTLFLNALGTRRTLVRSGVAALGVGALALVGRDEVAGKRRRKRRKMNNRPGGGSLGGDQCDVCDDEDDCPFQTIQAALDAAAAGATITICEGAYDENIVIAKNVTLAGDNGESEIEGTGDGSVVTVNAGVTAVLSGLLIAKGTGTLSGGARSGGGIFNLGDLTLQSVVVQKNEAVFGAGIFNQTRATLTMSNTIVQNNDAVGVAQTYGGGICNKFGGEITITGASQVVFNKAANAGAIHNQGVLTISGKSILAANKVAFTGGGIINDEGNITLDDSTIEANVAKGDGGGIFNANGTVLIRNNSEIGDNEAEDGAGIYNLGNLTVNDSAVTNNDAEELGGGIFNGGGTVNLQSSTVFMNDAGETGGGIFNTQGGVVTLDAQSAVVGNDPNNCVGTNACAG